MADRSEHSFDFQRYIEFVTQQSLINDFIDPISTEAPLIMHGDILQGIDSAFFQICFSIINKIQTIQSNSEINHDRNSSDNNNNPFFFEPTLGDWEGKGKQLAQHLLQFLRIQRERVNFLTYEDNSRLTKHESNEVIG